MMRVVLPPSLHVQINKKIVPILGPGFEHIQVDHEALEKILSLAGPYIAMCVLKSHLNAWNTSYRHHDPVLRGCVFGCTSGGDDICHYVECEPLWAAIQARCDGPVSNVVEERWCYVRPTRTSARTLAIAYTVYHSSKLCSPVVAGSTPSSEAVASFRDQLQNFVRAALLQTSGGKS